jgi:hypothetical protein
MSEEELKQIKWAVDWLEAALDCKTFVWDCDQEDAAREDLRKAKEILVEVQTRYGY